MIFNCVEFYACGDDSQGVRRAVGRVRNQSIEKRRKWENKGALGPVTGLECKYDPSQLESISSYSLSSSPPAMKEL